MVAADLEVELENLAKIEARLRKVPDEARSRHTVLQRAMRTIALVVLALEGRLDQLEAEDDDR